METTTDSERIARLYREHGPAIYARCQRLLGDPVAAEAAAVECFLRLLRRLDRGVGVEGVAGWIEKITTAHCLVEIAGARPEAAAPARATEGELDGARFLFTVYQRTLPAVSAATAGRAPGGRPRRLGWGAVVGGAAAVGLVAAALVLFLPRAREERRDPVDLGAVASKGSSELVVWARQENRLVALDRYGRVVHPGTEIRFILTGVPEGQAHVLVASVDGAGAVNVYYPYDGQSSAPVPGPGRWEVPGSIILDDTLGPERVYAFFSPAPMATATVRSALEALARKGTNAVRNAPTIDLPGTTQRSFLFYKVPRP